ncbi:MAG TPA: phosphoribosylglycinamide formyltransferase [Longimicrobiaceae bacterium]|nr:phosphoribosylglycinamide formyltransferase [Longimicrobiaceae bacterium]
MRTPARLAVFASGGGTNLQALLDHFEATPDPAARVELVVASRAGIGALSRAESAGVLSVVIDPATHSPDELGGETMRQLDGAAIDLIVLAGYLKRVPRVVVEAFAERIINIHPARLPSFGGPGMYGLRVHRAVLDSGATVTGATVHRVGERYDEGPIVAQWPVPVIAGDTPESLAARVLRVEHVLLPAAVEAIVTGRPPTPLPEEVIFDLSATAAPAPDVVRRIFR